MSIKLNDIDEIIPDLYLGNLTAANNITKLKELCISKVLSIIDEPRKPKYKESDNIIHKVILVNDLLSQNIIKYFGECLKFIKGDEKILVHCAAGASRSASIVIAYLMWDKKMSYHMALNFVKDKRFIIYPNRAFKEQLQLFEKLLKENEYDIDKINFEKVEWKLKDDAHF